MLLYKIFDSQRAQISTESVLRALARILKSKTVGFKGKQQGFLITSLYLYIWWLCNTTYACVNSALTFCSVHNCNVLFCREALEIKKRILIIGSGVLGETKIDQRANSPTFRITHNCVIQNLDIDMTGFRECVHVTGKQNVTALLRNCLIK